MQINKIDGVLFKTLVVNGAENLRLHYQYIDSLNVFPVPDGDTGTNMKMTIEGGVNEIYSMDEHDIYEVSKKLSRGMLMGARGNSGVILSQLFRGISKGFEGLQEADAIRLAQAFDAGVKQAYKAVMKPVEGTILTVAREASEKLLAISSSRMSINEFFHEYLEQCKITLEKTPDLLPVLKEANVVDSGGAGLIQILEGMAMALDGKFVSEKTVEGAMHTVGTKFINKVENAEFGYCTEFVLQLSKDKNTEDFEETIIANLLDPIGNSMVVVKDEDIVKVHIHTLKPGDVLNIGQQFGEFVHLKIENMTIQHNESAEVKQAIQHVEEGQCECGEVHVKPVKKPEVRKKYAIVSVASGKGLINAFKDMGADYVVSGGQSMNPSTEDFIRGFDMLNAEHIFVFPNNSNIILAAAQSAKIYQESQVHVVETRTLAQGFAALTMLDLNGEPDEIIKNLQPTIDNVTTGEITYSIRDTTIDGLSIKKDDFIGIRYNKDGKKIVSCNRKRYETVKSLLKDSVTEEKEIITIIYGADVTQKEVNDIVRHIEKNYSNLEVDTIEGNQEVYSYILAIE